MRCGECKFFGEEVTLKDENWNDTPTGFHTCDRIKHFKNIYPESVSDLPKDPAYVEDGSGYFAAIRVRSDFGCVMFEEAGQLPREGE